MHHHLPFLQACFLGTNTRSTGPCLVWILSPTEGQTPTHCDVLRVSPAKVFFLKNKQTPIHQSPDPGSWRLSPLERAEEMDAKLSTLLGY